MSLCSRAEPLGEGGVRRPLSPPLPPVTPPWLRFATPAEGTSGQPERQLMLLTSTIPTVVMASGGWLYSPGHAHPPTDIFSHGPVGSQQNDGSAAVLPLLRLPRALPLSHSGFSGPLLLLLLLLRSAVRALLSELLLT